VAAKVISNFHIFIAKYRRRSRVPSVFRDISNDNLPNYEWKVGGQ
jgi:hypothetical protein